ncbi:MAG: FMN-binding protein [Rhodoglobus sp.]
MRTRAVVTSIFASFAVLVVGWQAGNAASTSVTSSPLASGSTGGNGSTGTVGTGSTGTSGTGTTGATGGTTTTTTGAADGTYTGSSVNTPFGSVQVQVTIASGAITDVGAVHLTDADGRSVQISNHAAPILRTEVLSAQSASVSNVSGATYTTRGYLMSLQSALDQAGF